MWNLTAQPFEWGASLLQKRLDIVSDPVSGMNTLAGPDAVKSQGRLDPLSIGFLRSEKAVFGNARLMQLLKESYGCRMTFENTKVNM